ncbi:MAG: photosynthetic reaction center cytochrome PufC, partial [Pseudomonadota bacterium]
CHRGNNVPEYIWFEDDPADDRRRPHTAMNYGQNLADEDAGLSSLPGAPLEYFLGGDSERLDRIRVATDGWQPSYDDDTIRHTEMTYSLMFHMSGSLGVNCTFCHNSRSFQNWPESTPQRVTAWHGLRMVSNLNGDYLVPLQPVYPDNRLGPTKDAPKANCATCHQGLNQPLGGANMVNDYEASMIGVKE